MPAHITQSERWGGGLGWYERRTRGFSDVDDRLLPDEPALFASEEPTTGDKELADGPDSGPGRGGEDAYNPDVVGEDGEFSWRPIPGW